MYRQHHIGTSQLRERRVPGRESTPTYPTERPSSLVAGPLGLLVSIKMPLCNKFAVSAAHAIIQFMRDARHKFWFTNYSLANVPGHDCSCSIDVTRQPGFRD